MRLLLSVVLVFASVLAKDWPIQNRNRCTPGTKFIEQKGAWWLWQCVAVKKTVTSKLVGCLDDNGNDSRIGQPFDRIMEPQYGDGFRYNCTGREGILQLTGCLFAKGTVDEIATTGVGSVVLKKANLRCTCTLKFTNSYNYGCESLPKGG